MMRGGKEKRVLESTTPAQQSLGEAITALRRGEPVLVRDDEINVLAVAAELATEENLQRLREISRAPARGVLARRGARRAGTLSRGARPARGCRKCAPDRFSPTRWRPRTSRDPDRVARSVSAGLGAAAFGVFYRRPARQPALRLRRPAARRDRRDRRGRRRGAALPCAGRTRHRARQQTAGLSAAGCRFRHTRR